MRVVSLGRSYQSIVVAFTVCDLCLYMTNRGHYILEQTYEINIC